MLLFFEKSTPEREVPVMKLDDCYRTFSPKEMGRNKIITNHLLEANLGDPFVFWKIFSTKKFFFLKAVFFFITLFSVIFWLYMIAMKSFTGSQYGFLLSVASLYTLWFIQKNEISPQAAINCYHQSRKKYCSHEGSKQKNFP